MNPLIPHLLSKYVADITAMIAAKYGFECEAALRKFLYSETYRLLSTPSLRMWDFTSDVIFEMWEVEHITGNPRNAVCLREMI